MSDIARWSYMNTATVKPATGEVNEWGAAVYGEPYEIACNWIAKSQQMRNDRGHEFVSRNIIYTEDARPKYLDLIRLNGDSEFQQIESVTGWDMNMFNTNMDFMLVT